MIKAFPLAPVALVAVAMLTGCGTLTANTPSTLRHQDTVARQSSQPPSPSLAASPSGSGQTRPRASLATPPTTSGESTAVSSQVSPSPEAVPSFDFVFAPHITAKLNGGGAGGSSALLGTIKSNSEGLMPVPNQPGWFYGIQYQNVQVNVTNNAQGQSFINIPQNTAYRIVSTRTNQVVATGNSGLSGDIMLPLEPKTFLTVVYGAEFETKVSLYETTP